MKFDEFVILPFGNSTILSFHLEIRPFCFDEFTFDEYVFDVFTCHLLLFAMMMYRDVCNFGFYNLISYRRWPIPKEFALRWCILKSYLSYSKSPNQPGQKFGIVFLAIHTTYFVLWIPWILASIHPYELFKAFKMRLYGLLFRLGRHFIHPSCQHVYKLSPSCLDTFLARTITYPLPTY